MANDDSGGGVFFLVAVGVGIFLYSDSSWSNSVWYSFQHDVGFGDVITEAKPPDCNFLQAPLGIKGCSYKAIPKAYNADGVLVAGTGAPKFASDTNTNRPILSYDDGKTWHWYVGESLPSTKPKLVRVYWLKE